MKGIVISLIVGLVQTIIPPQSQSAGGYVPRNLSEPAVKLLLVGDRGFVTYLDKDWERSDSDAPAVRELRARGLVVLITPQDNKQYAYEVTLTALGTDAYASCMRVLRAQSPDLTEPAVQLLFTLRFRLKLLAGNWETTSRYASAVRELGDKGLVVVSKSDHPKYPYQATFTASGTKRYASGLRFLRTQLLEQSRRPVAA